MTKLSLPSLSLVVLVGPSGSGKSTFARKHFSSTEVISSDYCRGLVSDDENDQAATNDAFDLLHTIVEKRLARGRLTVVDATNVQKEARQPLVAVARKYHVLPIAIVLNTPEGVCHERNRDRADRNFGPHVVRHQRSQLRRSLKYLRKDGFRHVFVLESVDEVESATIERVPLWNDKRSEHGPFDIIGDIHGCADELEALLENLGYEKHEDENHPPSSLLLQPFYSHPAGRKAVFVGDLVDRGPRNLDATRIVASMVHCGSALCVPGNHDVKLLRKLRGKNPKPTHGLTETWGEVEALPDEVRDPFCSELANFIDGLVSHYVLDDGKLVVAHAGLKEEMQGRGSGKVREFAIYGETTGESDEFGLPVRLNWAADYRGTAAVVYGHTPTAEPEWLNNTVCIDTGCVFGGKLTAMRYPEREFVSVPAARTYYDSSRPFLPSDTSVARSTQHELDDTLDAADVIGKRIIETRLHRNVTVRAENATAALEVMSRFAANPKWLIYLPPTMSPPETHPARQDTEAQFLEHPNEAFAYYLASGVGRVVCEEKHMGSRAVAIVCQNESIAAERFGVVEAERGIVYTRTGRRFFNETDLEQQFLARLQRALTAANFWEHFQTTWVCFDCELLPWSAKAQELLRSQYAAVGAAGQAALPAVTSALQTAQSRLAGEESAAAASLSDRFSNKAAAVSQFVNAYRHYCWPVDSIDDLKLAPFHVLATEGKVHIDRTHEWHMQTIAEVCRHDEQFLLATPHRTVDLTNADSTGEAVAWWEQMTSTGGEGMVVKPLDWIVRGQKGLVQPAIKCRGREYLRIIYGPDYDAPENISRLRSRHLGRKRSLAVREFSLGVEALERFVRREPLRRVHECVFGVLALESEPVDPRL